MRGAESQNSSHTSVVHARGRIFPRTSSDAKPNSSFVPLPCLDSTRERTQQSYDPEKRPIKI
jgi:hypothetical protein